MAVSRTPIRRIPLPAWVCVATAVATSPLVAASHPRDARYASDSDGLYWFMHVSDLHISKYDSNKAADHLRLALTEAVQVIQPACVVATGDLVDGAALLGITATGQSQEEWDLYQSAYRGAGVGARFYFDLPGNHDSYADQGLTHFRESGLQSAANGKLYVDWERAGPDGRRYYFFGLNSAGLYGAPLSFGNPEFLADETSALQAGLHAHAADGLVFVFAHHPLNLHEPTDLERELAKLGVIGPDNPPANSGAVKELLKAAGAFYFHGHLHELQEYVDADGQVVVHQIGSLGKDDVNNIGVAAIDHGALVYRATATSRLWPMVMITAPVDHYLRGGGNAPDDIAYGTIANPWAYPVCKERSDNVVRALVFAKSAPGRVHLELDGTTVGNLLPVAGHPSLWAARVDTVSQTAGEHRLAVVATGAGDADFSARDEITVRFAAGPCAPGDAGGSPVDARDAGRSSADAGDTDARGGSRHAAWSDAAAAADAAANVDRRTTLDAAAGWPGFAGSNRPADTVAEASATPSTADSSPFTDARVACSCEIPGRRSLPAAAGGLVVPPFMAIARRRCRRAPPRASADKPRRGVRRILGALWTSALSLSLVHCAPPADPPRARASADAAAAAAEEVPVTPGDPVDLCIVSDPHVYEPSLGVTIPSGMEQVAQQIFESAAIFASTMESIARESCSIVILPGDLTRDGESASHDRVVSVLAQLEAAGKQAFVVPGNHDVDSAAAVGYTDRGPTSVPALSRAQFAERYRRFGYDEAISRDQQSLSYVVQATSGLWLLGLDTGGALRQFSASTIAWATARLADARRRGARVLAFAHHGLVEHFPGNELLLIDPLVQGWESHATALERAGLRLVFTGHQHVQDIAKHEGSAFLFDVATSSLAGYPSEYRVASLDETRRLVRLTTRRSSAVTPTSEAGELQRYAYNRVFAVMDSKTRRGLASLGLSDAQVNALQRVLVPTMIAYSLGDEPRRHAPEVDSPMAALSGQESRARTVLSAIWSDRTGDNEVDIDLETGVLTDREQGQYPIEAWTPTVVSPPDAGAPVDIGGADPSVVDPTDEAADANAPSIVATEPPPAATDTDAAVAQDDGMAPQVEEPDPTEQADAPAED